MIRFPSPQEYRIIRLIAESTEGQLYGAKLASLCGIVPTAIYKPLQALLSKSLIEPCGKGKGSDGRARATYLYRLTAPGRAIYELCERFKSEKM